MARRTRWIFGGQTSSPQAAQDISKPLPVPVIASADAKKFGFENFGNTCYANSVLQALYFCAPFRDLILQSSDPSLSQKPPSPAVAPAPPRPPSPPPVLAPVRRKPERRQSASGGPSDTIPLAVPPIPADPATLFSALRSLFFYISTHPAERGTVAPRAFIGKLKEVNTAFDSTMHQDAHEFLNFLLNRIVEEVGEQTKAGQSEAGDDLSNSVAALTTSSNSGSSSQDATLVHRLFEGVLTSETRCLTCETISSRDESFLDLSIDIEQNSSVTACLRQFSASEMLCQKNKFFCDACCDLQEAEKRMKIKKLPNVLALHLKRFKYQEDAHVKLAYRVAFPFELRLFNTVDGIENADRLYNLFAIVVHIGKGPHHGHYVAIVKTLDNWLLFDDDNVTPMPENEIAKYFGDSASGSAYVLYYQAVDLDLPSLGLARDMVREMEAKGEPMSVQRGADSLEISAVAEKIIEGGEGIPVQGDDVRLALPPGLVVEDPVNNSDVSLGGPGTPSTSSISASGDLPLSTSSRENGAGSIPPPFGGSHSLPGPGPSDHMRSGAAITNPSSSTEANAAGKMGAYLRKTIKKTPSMSIKTSLSAVRLGNSASGPPLASASGLSSSLSPIEAGRPSTAGSSGGKTKAFSTQGRRSVAAERSPTSTDVNAAFSNMPVPPVQRGDMSPAAAAPPSVPPNLQTLYPSSLRPLAAPHEALSEAMSAPAFAEGNGKLEEGDVPSDSGAEKENGKDEVNRTGKKEKERGVKAEKKSSTWFTKRKSFKIGEKGVKLDVNVDSVGDVSPPSPLQVRAKTFGGNDSHAQPLAGSSSSPPAPSTWFRTSMHKPRRPVESDVHDPQTPSVPPQDQDMNSSHHNSTQPLPLSAPSLPPAPAASISPPLSPNTDSHNRWADQPRLQPLRNPYDAYTSPPTHDPSPQTQMHGSPLHPVPRIQSSVSTPSPTTPISTQPFPDHLDNPPTRKSSLPKQTPSPERKRSTPSFPSFRASNDGGADYVPARMGLTRPSTAGAPVRSNSGRAEGERLLPPVPPLPIRSDRRPVTNGSANGNGLSLVKESGTMTGEELSEEPERAPGEDLQSAETYVPSSYASQPSPSFGLASFGSTNHSSASSSASSNLKRATRKLSLTAPMLGFGKKDKDREREKEYGKDKDKKLKEKAGPSSFSRF